MNEKFKTVLSIIAFSVVLALLGCSGEVITAPDSQANDANTALSRDGQYMEPVHKDILTEYIIQFYVAKYPEDTQFIDWLTNPAYGGQYRNKLRQGAYDEDSPMTRSLNHFMTPASQVSFPTSPSGFKKLSDWLPGSYNALEWFIGIAGSSNTYTFSGAVTDFKNNNPAGGFDKMGHVLHLLEDMAMPCHVRNDGHPAILNPDTFETWTSQSGFTTYSQYLYNNMVAGLPRIGRTSSGFPSYPVLQTAYNLAANSTIASYRNFPGPSALTWFVCWTANNVAFSKDTIGKSTQSGIDTSRAPAITSYVATYNSSTGKWSAKFYWTPYSDLQTTMINMGILGPSDFPFLVAISNSSFDSWYKSNLNATPDKVWAAHKSSALLTISDSNDNNYSVTPSMGVLETQARILFPLCVLNGAAMLHEAYLKTYQP